MPDSSEGASPPVVKVQPNGPYLVSGLPLRSKAPINTEEDEPLTWRHGDVDDDGPRYALCRCGGSANKPYCDGTHVSIEFDGTERALDSSYGERRTSLGGTSIEVFDDRSICAHAGFCGDKISNIWNMAADTSDTQTAARVMGMVANCPSGAITYEVGGEQVEQSMAAEVSATKDGPLAVTGGVHIERSDGVAVEVRNRVTLCRCGQSNNKPFCDGSHWEAGFRG